MSNSSKQIKLGAIVSYFSIGFNIIAGLIYTPWMINSIGKDQYALYTLALSVINIFLLDFGISSAVSKFLANFYAKGEQEEADRFMGIVYKVFFIISAVIAAALLIFYFFIDTVYVKLTPAELTVFKNLFIIVAAYSVISFPCMPFTGVLMANERFIEVKLLGFLHKVFEVILIVAFLLLGFGVYSLVLVHALSSVVFHLLRYVIIKKKTKQKAHLAVWNKQQAKSLFGYSIWVTIISLAQRCIFNIAPSIIAALVGSVEVTFFSLAATIEGYIYTFANAINGMFLPKISRILVKENSENELNSLLLRVSKFHVYTIGLVTLCFIALGQNFVELWLGKGFNTVYYAAILIILPSLIELPQQIAKSALLAKDIVKQQAIIYVVMAALNLLVSFVAVPYFGAIGAAAAICLAYLFRTFAANYLYKKHLNIKIGEYFKKTYLKWSISAILTLLVGFGLNFVFKDVNFITFIASVCIMTAVYFVTLFFTDIDKNDRIPLLKKLK